MISILVYGRNDSRGYNMHKRVALSLNCMASVLDADGDEIVFVDYNSPDDFPTLPEAIQDTLTPQLKSLLKIVRVRPSHHELIRKKTHLPVVESVARNIGARYCNPENRWILSTNTDMIFHPVGGGSLSEIAAALQDGYYGIPRFELPEGLWEELDRSSPLSSRKMIASWGHDFHLREKTVSVKEILFDAPGDFQLFPRDVLFRINGFNEKMLKGWHVDSNLCRRMQLVFGNLSDLSTMVEGYHCSHNRVATLSHGSQRIEDSFDKYVFEVSSPFLADQSETWGLCGVSLEKIYLTGENNGLSSKLVQLGMHPAKTPWEVVCNGGTYDMHSYEVQHLLPFIADLLLQRDKNSCIAWVGRHRKMFQAFLHLRKVLGHSGPTLVADVDSTIFSRDQVDKGEVLPLSSMDKRWDIMFFDFVSENGEPIKTSDPLEQYLLRSFRRVVESERDRMEDGLLSRTIAAINTINNRFENVVRTNLNVFPSPFTTRIRHGQAAPRNKDPQDWLQRALLGVAGEATELGISAVAGRSGHVSYGPYASLSRGRYRVEFILQTLLELKQLALRPDMEPPVFLDVVSLLGKNTFAEASINSPEFIDGVHVLRFDVSDDDIDSLLSDSVEARVFSSGAIPFNVVSVTLYPEQEKEQSMTLATTGNHVTAVVVEAIYRSLLEREVDPGGLVFYTNMINNEGIDSCISSILNSEEFKKRRP